MKAAPLKVAKIMYIFQLTVHDLLAEKAIMIRIALTVSQKRWYGECKDTIPEPIGGGGKRDSLGANLGRIDLRRICPGSRSPCSSKSTDEKVSHCDDGLGNRFVVIDNPCYAGV